MTSLGKKVAKPPISPHASLTAVERIGTNKQGSAIWRLQCSCGKTLEANAYAIKQGWAHCSGCNPRYGEQLATEILAVLPATIEEIVEKTSLTLHQVKFRLRKIKPILCHAGRWKRANGKGGSHQPVICAGPGEDVPCPFKTRTVAENSRRYRKRVKKAVENALAGGRKSSSYTRIIARRQADELVKKTRVTPQTWLSALM